MENKKPRENKTSLVVRLNLENLKPIFNPSKHNWVEYEDLEDKTFSHLLELRENLPNGLYLKDKLETNVQSVIMFPHEINYWPVCYKERKSSAEKEHIVGYVFPQSEESVKH